jgi:hypothetical protein
MRSVRLWGVRAAVRPSGHQRACRRKLTVGAAREGSARDATSPTGDAAMIHIVWHSCCTGVAQWCTRRPRDCSEPPTARAKERRRGIPRGSAACRCVSHIFTCSRAYHGRAVVQHLPRDRPKVSGILQTEDHAAGDGGVLGRNRVAHDGGPCGWVIARTGVSASVCRCSGASLAVRNSSGSANAPDGSVLPLLLLTRRQLYKAGCT